MWNTSNLTDKKFNEETFRVIGEDKLHEFGDFVEEFSALTNIFEAKFPKNINVSNKAIIIDEEVRERVPLLYLARSDNSTLSRILATLAGLCRELKFLMKEAQSLYPYFLFYGEEVEKSTSTIESMSNIIEPLQKTSVFIKRSRKIVVLTLRQISAILSKGYYITSSTPSFSELFSHLADLLLCTLKTDTLLDDQIIKNHWLVYRRSLSNFLHKGRQFGSSIDELRALTDTLNSLDSILFSGTIFKDTIECCSEGKVIVEMKNSSLSTEMYNFISSQVYELETNDDIILSTDLYIQLNIFVALYSNIYGNPDKKFIKRLMELNKKMSMCTLIGNIIWYPEQFLLKYIQSANKFIDEKNMESYRRAEILSKAQNLPKEVNSFSTQTCNFLIELESKMKINATSLKVRELRDINFLLVDGLKLAKKMSWAVAMTMNVHLDKNLRVTKTVLSCISQLVEMLECICLSVRRHVVLLNYFICLISQHLQHISLNLLDGLKKNLTQPKSYKDHELDILSAIKVCDNSLKGPNTKWRILMTHLSLSASGLTTLTEIRTVLDHLKMISEFSKLLTNDCDCSMLYWHFNVILPVYFSKLIASKSNFSKSGLLLNALTDCEETVEKEISSEASIIFKDKLSGPLNQIIETNLRLQTHLHLQLPPSDPFQNFCSLNFEKFEPMPLSNVYKSIKNETEHYLSTTFYNLTTVVLHDWKTYGGMRRLANLQYRLETVDDELPMQTLDQGLDVLEIMRNINVFVQKYLYNLNSQIFIEYSSNSKTLNSINISHVANSIRTHGIGIMNTTVNYTYQFLKNKFRIFSQFLYDEQIKSRLLKDLRYFSENKDDLNQMYPYERADNFNKGIRKLGTPDGAEGYLDHFRKVITHIGNAMGYVRLVRSGGNRCIAEGTCFIPDLTEQINIPQTDDLTDSTNNALAVLIKEINNFKDNFKNTTEYFKLLVNAFTSHFTNSDNVHLRNFYVIVPPLTINFVETSLTCKEKLFKKDKTHSAFTDDGFALGLAYIIELLDQESQFNSLHWFESVQQKIELENLKIVQTLRSHSEDAKLKQTLILTEKRINSFQKEFKLLEYSFSSARLFFQS